MKSQQLITVSPTTPNIRDPFYTQNNENKMNNQENSTLSMVDDSDDQNSYKTKAQQEQKKRQELHRLAQKKVVIGGGFSLDMSDFFKFKAIKKMQGEGFQQLVTGGHLAWIILLYSVCNAAIMPAWIMSIKANKILRISWRFLLQAIFIIPFVLYERRTGCQSTKKKYSFKYVFAFEGIKKVYISSIGTSIWFTIILSCFEWTYISHSLVLGSLSNFFLSINRSINHSTHSLQPGGQIFVLVGILFTLSDSYMMNVQQAPHSVWNVINPLYLTRSSIQRVLADLAALSGAFIISRFSQKSADLKTYYPPFLSMFLVNISIYIHVGLSAYFINGATFDRDTDFGVWGLFTDVHFGAFFYMAVILSFGTYLSFTLISKLFSDPIIPALAMTLEPFFATFFLNLVSVQSMPGSFSIYGYIFLLCGLFLILIGQFVLQKQKEKKEKETKVQAEIKEKFMKRDELVSMEVIEEQLEKSEMKDSRLIVRLNVPPLGIHGHSDVLRDGKSLTI